MEQAQAQAQALLETVYPTSLETFSVIYLKVEALMDCSTHDPLWKIQVIPYTALIREVLILKIIHQETALNLPTNSRTIIKIMGKTIVAMEPLHESQSIMAGMLGKSTSTSIA